MRALKAAGALAESLFGMLESRLELFSEEFALEQARLAALGCYIALGCGSLLLACMGFTACLILAVPPEYRLLALALFSGAYFIVFLLFLFLLIKLLNQQDLPFAATRQELKEDITCFVSAIKDKKS